MKRSGTERRPLNTKRMSIRVPVEVSLLLYETWGSRDTWYETKDKNSTKKWLIWVLHDTRAGGAAPASAATPMIPHQRR